MNDVIELLELRWFFLKIQEKTCDHGSGMRAGLEECFTHKRCNADQRASRGKHCEELWKSNTMVTITEKSEDLFYVKRDVREG